MENVNPLHTFLFALCIFVFSACDTDPYQYGASDSIELKKDPCFGFCPVYTFRIDGRGNAAFEGVRNVEKEGQWSQVFPPDQTNDLFKAFEKSNFWDFDDEYVAQVTDLPTTWLTFRFGEAEKKIKDYYGAPPELKELEKMAEMMAESEEGWAMKSGE